MKIGKKETKKKSRKKSPNKIRRSIAASLITSAYTELITRQADSMALASLSILEWMNRRDDNRIWTLSALLWRGYSEEEAIAIIKKTEESLEQ